MDSPSPETAPAVVHQHQGSEAGSVTKNAVVLRAYRAAKRAAGKCMWCGRPSGERALCAVCRGKEGDRKSVRRQAKYMPEIITISRAEIVAKIEEAREKQRWHKERNYFEEAEYFNGWAVGLEQLLKEPTRPGRKPKPQNK